MYRKNQEVVNAVFMRDLTSLQQVYNQCKHIQAVEDACISKDHGEAMLDGILVILGHDWVVWAESEWFVLDNDEFNAQYELAPPVPSIINVTVPGQSISNALAYD